MVYPPFAIIGASCTGLIPDTLEPKKECWNDIEVSKLSTCFDFDHIFIMYHKNITSVLDNSEKGWYFGNHSANFRRFGSTTNAGSKLSSLTQRERA